VNATGDPADVRSLERSHGELNYFDQAAFELLRVTGRVQLLQHIWVYEHPVDIEALRQFYQAFGSGLFGRLIERSPLPFARPRWVSRLGPQQDIITADNPRQRAELMDWADELAMRPIDPERGPGWILGILPMTDGSTAVSTVTSHCLVDGGGATLTIWNLIRRCPQDFGYAKPKARSHSRAVMEDLRASLGEVPQLVRALVHLGALAVKNRRSAARPSSATAQEIEDVGDPGQVVLVPSLVATIDTEMWDARAKAVGGNTFSLVAGFAARIAQHLGRVRRSDQHVTLVVPRDRREGTGDDRAFAISFANAEIEPEKVTSDLTEAREVIRTARARVESEPDPVANLLPLVPWFPRSVAKALANLMFSYEEALPVSCSNVGDVPEELANIDGTAADFFFARSIDQNVTLRDLQRSQGTLVVVSGRINGKIWLAVEAYQLGVENSKVRLREMLQRTLDEFELSGVIH
jgi:hypothetical protein